MSAGVPLVALAALQGVLGDVIRVRTANRDTILVPVVATAAGPAVASDAVLPLVGGSLRRAGGGRWVLELAGVAIELSDGVPFARVDTLALPLAGAPVLRGEHPLVPLQVLVDLVPRFGANLNWLADRRELRVFAGNVRRVTQSVSRPSAPVRAAAARGAGAPVAAPSPNGRSNRMRTVVLDAGHGGVDRGMSGPIGGGFVIHEKDITLQVARRAADMLEREGVRVAMTRTTDTLIALADRGRMANRDSGDVFISIHVNAANMRWSEPAAARGFETYFLAEAKTEDDRRVAAMENEVVRFESGAAPPTGDALGFILHDMMQNEHLRESSDLAAVVQARLLSVHPGPSRGVKQAGFLVLVRAYMPAVLVEIGFGTNEAEARWLASAEGQRQIARAIADAALEYLAHYERRVRTQGPRE